MNKKLKDKSEVVFLLPLEQKKELTHLAEKQGMTRAAFVKMLVKMGLSSFKKATK